MAAAFVGSVGQSFSEDPNVGAQNDFRPAYVATGCGPGSAGRQVVHVTSTWLSGSKIATQSILDSGCAAGVCGEKTVSLAWESRD